MTSFGGVEHAFWAPVEGMYTCLIRVLHSMVKQIVKYDCMVHIGTSLEISGKNTRFFFYSLASNLLGTHEWAVAWGYLLLYFWTASIWEWSQTEVRKGERKISHDSLNSWTQSLKTGPPFQSVRSFCAAHRSSFVVIWCIKFKFTKVKYHEPRPREDKVGVCFAFLSFVFTQWKNLWGVCFPSLKGLIMLLFQQRFHIRDNFYTVSSALKIYLTERNCVFSNDNAGDVSKGLC